MHICPSSSYFLLRMLDYRSCPGLCNVPQLQNCSLWADNLKGWRVSWGLPESGCSKNICSWTKRQKDRQTESSYVCSILLPNSPTDKSVVFAWARVIELAWRKMMDC